MRYHIESCAWESIYRFLDEVRGIHTNDEEGFAFLLRLFGLLLVASVNDVFCLKGVGEIGVLFIDV